MLVIEYNYGYYSELESPITRVIQMTWGKMLNGMIIRATQKVYS